MHKTESWQVIARRAGRLLAHARNLEEGKGRGYVWGRYPTRTRSWADLAHANACREWEKTTGKELDPSVYDRLKAPA